MSRSKVVNAVVIVACIASAGACTGARVPTNVAAGTSTTLKLGETTATGDTTATTLEGFDPATGATVPKVTVPGATTTRPPSPPARSTLFNAKEDNVGITKSSITLCAHAALTYGAAFNTSADDLNVFWSAVNDAGGIFGRKVAVTYENDNYSPDTAVQAATACQDKNIFMLLGGIGFDQIPAVRNWAEANRMLYLHHTATVNGTANQGSASRGCLDGEAGRDVRRARRDALRATRRSASSSATVPTGSPASTHSRQIAQKCKLNIVADAQGAEQPGQLHPRAARPERPPAPRWCGSGRTRWRRPRSSNRPRRRPTVPTWLLFPFNLTSQTLGNDALNPKMIGVAMYAAYSQGDYSGSFAAYADDLKQFEAQYRKYRPNVDLGGRRWRPAVPQLDGAEGPRGVAAPVRPRLHAQPDGRRDVIAEAHQAVLVGLRHRLHPAGFFADGRIRRQHHGDLSLAEQQVNWRNTDTCVEHLV